MKYKNNIFVRAAVFMCIFFMTINSNVVFANNSKHNLNEDLQKDNKKIIYLTFDDGPSKLTDKFLDILKENNVKATFFLIGNQIEDNEQVVKRIYSEGHSIGLHTYTHKYRKIYKNGDSFIDEMNKSNELIKKVTGKESHLIRFPGGSRKHLNKNFLEKLHNNNFKIYDWNIQASDGINPKIPPYKLVKEATKDPDKHNPVILLMHCDYMHKNTCIALPEIIKYYKSQGYEFKPITEDTEEIYFPIKTNKASSFLEKLFKN
ncbi:polysaccharide deacetylase [Clostridium sp. AWRP]|nr:polysaccharide deacetylase [Clostridium sp. AWRP]